MPDPDPASYIFAFIFLLLTILFNLCDEAFSAVGETRLKELEEEDNRKAIRILRLTDKERQFTSRIRFYTLLCGMAGCILLFNAILPHVTSWLEGVSNVMGYTFTSVLSIVLVVCFAAFLYGALGCMLPRRLVHRNPEGTALALVPLFGFFYAILYPVYGLSRLICWPIVVIAGMDPTEDPDKVTEDDIIELIEDVEEIGALEESQKDMLNNIFEFDDISAAEIMTPRTDMVSIDVTDSIVEALATAVECGYSRLPVYEEDIDHIIGILYIKDLLPYVGRTIPKSVTIRKLLRNTLFVPDTKKCDELFEEMNNKHLQMAMVVDEYGGVAGLVTIEDLLESIVGNMQDEFDNEEEEVTKLDDDSFEIDAALSIGELEELLDTTVPEGDYDTVAGFLLDQLGHIPEEGEDAVIEYENLTFTVIEMGDRRIEQVLVRRTSAESAEESEEE